MVMLVTDIVMTMSFYGTNTVYVTPKGFQWIVSKISKEWMPRFLELKGRVLGRSDKDIFAKR